MPASSAPVPTPWELLELAQTAVDRQDWQTALEEIRDARRLLAGWTTAVDTLQAAAVEGAHASRWTWPQIGKALDVSGQAVWAWWRRRRRRN